MRCSAACLGRSRLASVSHAPRSKPHEWTSENCELQHSKSVSDRWGFSHSQQYVKMCQGICKGEKKSMLMQRASDLAKWQQGHTSLRTSADLLVELLSFRWGDLRIGQLRVDVVWNGLYRSGICAQMTGSELLEMKRKGKESQNWMRLKSGELSDGTVTRH